jgi:hypothetical protein
VLEDRRGTEPRVLPARRPGEVSERLQALVALDHIDPVAHLQSSHEREDLVRGEVERMQHEAELVVTDEREEPERVRGPT